MNRGGWDYDVAVVGGGSGGYAAARTATAAGKRVVVVDGAPVLGGLCILRGCMPSKALLYAAEVRHLARSGATWGLRVPEAGFDFPEVMARKRRMIDDFAAYRRDQLTAGKFELCRATARFLDPHTLELSDGRRITAAAVILATGSVVRPPPLPELADLGCWTSDDVLELTAPPRSLVVLGGGAVALELAQFLARFDTRVTVLQRGPHVLRELDADAADAVAGAFRREGIEVFTGTRLTGARRDGAMRRLRFEQGGVTHEVSAEAVLLAMGRVPNTAGLNLAAAGVATEAGRIVTDRGQRTNVPHIFACGDCTGPHAIVHLAIQQGEIAAANAIAAGPVRHMDYRLLMNVVFTDPQVATVGLTEHEAARQGIPVLAASYPFRDHGKSMIMEALDGFVKLLADPVTGAILGGACVGPVAGELIHEIAVAMAGRLTVQELAVVPHYHPTLAEIWTYPAEELAGQVGTQLAAEPR